MGEKNITASLLSKVMPMDGLLLRSNMFSTYHLEALKSKVGIASFNVIHFILHT
jgi:hypothetical protein